MATPIEEQLAGIALPPTKLVKIDQLMTTTDRLIQQIQCELMPLVKDLQDDAEVIKMLESAAGYLLAVAVTTSGTALVGSYIKG
ncbi:hypothetical protein ACV1DN_13440 [Aeromonas allosaccharophila]